MEKNLNWVHCNICYNLYTKKEKNFFVLSCETKHILCGDCMQKTNQGRTCPLCKSSIQYVEINGQMRPKSKQYFDLEARFRIFEEFIRIREFQDWHIDHLHERNHEYAMKVSKVNEMINAKQKEVAKYELAIKRALEYQRRLNDSKNSSSGYGSTSYSTLSDSQLSFLEKSTATEDIFKDSKSSSLFENNPLPKNVSQSRKTPPLSGHSIIDNRPVINSSRPFHTQKASTPKETSREKVMTQDFSFRSTPSVSRQKTRK